MEGVRLEKCKHGGIRVTFGASLQTNITPTWQIAGWQIFFARLTPREKLPLSHSSYVKVIRGALSTPKRAVFAPPKEARSTRINENCIQAGGNGALVAIFIKTAAAQKTISSAQQLAISGPHSDFFALKKCEEYEWGKAFAGVPFYNLRGFELMGCTGKKICYVQFWAAGKGVNCGMHDHSGDFPTFCEIHLCLFNGTGKGGMVDEKGNLLPLPEGFEHGPFWEVDSASGKPLLRENGTVKYQMHRWQAGGERARKNENEAFDVWAVFEISPNEATV